MRARQVCYGLLILALLAITLIFVVYLIWSGCGIWRIPC